MTKDQLIALARQHKAKLEFGTYSPDEIVCEAPPDHVFNSIKMHTVMTYGEGYESAERQHEVIAGHISKGFTPCEDGVCPAWSNRNSHCKWIRQWG